MAKKEAGKKTTGGKHKKKRGGINPPLPWLTLAHKLANNNGQPTMWYVCVLLKQAAIAQGVEYPEKMPWETGRRATDAPPSGKG